MDSTDSHYHPTLQQLHQHHQQQQAVIVGNNIGATLLTSGLYEKANYQLKLSLRHVNELLAQEAKKESDAAPAASATRNQIDTRHGKGEACCVSSQAPLFVKNVTTLDFQEETTSSSESSSSSDLAPSFIVWSRPLTIPSTSMTIKVESSGELPAPPNNAIIAATIVFNMALAHHLFANKKSAEETAPPSSSSAAAATNSSGGGRRTRTNNKLVHRLYQKAGALYEYTIRLLMSAPAVSGMSSSACTVYHIILANNMSHCHEQLGDFGRSEQCLQLLLRNILFVVHGRRKCRRHHPASWVAAAAPLVPQQQLPSSPPALSIQITLAEHLLPNVMHLFLAAPTSSRKDSFRLAPAA